MACTSSFDAEKAQSLLEKEQLSSDEYSELLEIYENGFDDAIKFSKDTDSPLSEKQKEEMLLIYAIGMRLSKDDASLSDKQRKEFERINLKGTEEASEK